MARLGKNRCDCNTACCDDRGFVNCPPPNPSFGVLEYDFNITQGEDLTIPLYLTDCMQHPINLMGYTAKCKIRKEYTGNPLDTLTTQNRRIKIDSSKSTINLIFPKSVTEKYKVENVNKRCFSYGGNNTYLYDVFITSSGGENTCILKGYVRIIPQVSY